MTEIYTLSEQERELMKESFATMSARERTLKPLAKKLANEIERLRASHDALFKALDDILNHFTVAPTISAGGGTNAELVENALSAIANAREVTI